VAERADLLPKWFIHSLVCIFWWGVFGFLAKIGSDRISPLQMQILFTIGMAMLALLVFPFSNRRIDTNKTGAMCGILIGVLAGLGGLAYFAAMRVGKASIVGPVTSLFPLLTIVLAAIFLNERMNKVQVIGVVLALASIVVLSF
jgi:bacterial/archaeal transporter family protein